MMQIRIMNRESAKAYISESHNEKSIIISISTDYTSDQNTILNNKNNGILASLHLVFDDIDIPGPTSINKFHAIKIHEFVDAWKQSVDLIIVNCFAGVSRSVGIAAAISLYINGSDIDIFNNGSYCPNMLCYRTLLAELTGSDIDENCINEKEQANITAWRIKNNLY